MLSVVRDRRQVEELLLREIEDTGSRFIQSVQYRGDFYKACDSKIYVSQLFILSFSASFQRQKVRQQDIK